MPRYIDKASLDVAVRRDPRTDQVLGYSIAKVPSFGPREQFLPRGNDHRLVRSQVVLQRP